MQSSLFKHITLLAVLFFLNLFFLIDLKKFEKNWIDIFGNFKIPENMFEIFEFSKYWDFEMLKTKNTHKDLSKILEIY